MDDIDFNSTPGSTMGIKGRHVGPIPTKIGDINEMIGRLNGVVDGLVERISGVLADLPEITDPFDKDDSAAPTGSSTLIQLREIEDRLSSLRSRVVAITERVEL